MNTQPANAHTRQRALSRAARQWARGPWLAWVIAVGVAATPAPATAQRPAPWGERQLPPYFVSAWMGWLNAVGVGVGAQWRYGPLHGTVAVDVGVGGAGASFGGGATVGVSLVRWAFVFAQTGVGQLHWRANSAASDGGSPPYRFVSAGGGFGLRTSDRASVQFGLHNKYGSVTRGGRRYASVHGSFSVAYARGFGGPR